jgi:hypothetical protein
LFEFSDVRKLLPEGILSEQQVTGIARAFNNKTGRVVISPSGQKVPISFETNLKCPLLRFKLILKLIPSLNDT